MPGRIALQLDNTAVSLASGEAIPIGIGLTNVGGVVDEFAITVEGLDVTWYTLEPAEVSLFPQERGLARLTLHPPAKGTVLAGDYAFSVQATSRDDPDDRAVASVVMHLEALTALSLAIEPQRIVARQGTFNVSLLNAGNTERPLVLRPSDPDEMLVFTFGEAQAAPRGHPAASPYAPPQPQDTAEAEGGVSVGRPLGEAGPHSTRVAANWIPPGNDVGQGYLELTLPAAAGVLVPMKVRTKKRIWTGSEAYLMFEVAATPPGVEWEPQEARRVVAEVVYVPYLARWSRLPVALRRTLAFALPLAMFALLLYLLLRPPDKAKGEDLAQTATQTAIALVSATAIAAAKLTATAGTSDTGGPVGTGTPAVAGTPLAIGTGGTPSIRRFFLVVPTPGPDLPVILSKGTSPNLQWDLTQAEGVRIDQASRPFDITGFESSTLLDFSLAAMSSGGVATGTLEVLLIRPAEIESFTATPMTITFGESATLEWRIKGGQSATLDDEPFNLGPVGNGVQGVSPSDTHVFVLCAFNPAGKVCKSALVTVLPAPTATPSNTSTATETATSTRTGTPVPTHTSTRAPTATMTATGVPTVTQTRTRAPSVTLTRTGTPPPTSTHTHTHTPSVTPTSTATPTYTPTPTPTAMPTHTSTPTFTLTPTPSPTLCPVFANTTSVQFPPYGSLESVIRVPISGTIQDLNVSLNISNPQRRDFSAFLYKVDGETTITLFRWFCVSGNAASSMNAILDDEAGAALNFCSSDISGTFRPGREPLSSFDGMNARGTWYLSFDFGPGLGPDQQPIGSLNSWSLQICTGSAQSPGERTSTTGLEHQLSPVEGNVTNEHRPGTGR